ncbi:hypothetical protein QTJ16_006483 [Diplocarpon rosae]|uniref:Uncharacterized protein n=1 Tax=Diplocarpon rosae TaxID=946125 RepID=A0AAD9STV8_9HELO|nr:hypothetical protein QTJ16_006483 [Diplocarpon rosae]
MGPRYKTSGSFDAYLPGQNVSPYLSQHSQAQQHDYSHDAFVQPQQGGQDDPFRTRDPLQQPRNSLAYPHSEYRMRSIQGQDIKNGSGDNALDRRNIGTVCEEDHRYRVTNYQPDDNDKDAVGEAQVEDGRQDLYQHANRATANSSPVKSIYQSNTRYDVPHYRPLLTSPVDYQNAANKRIEQEVTAVMAADGYINTSPCPEDMPRLAALVFDAITCTDPTVIEDKRNKNGKDAQAVVRLKTGFYEPAVIELAAWSIIATTQTASLGVSLIEPHHKGKFEGTDVHQTFFDRLDAIIVTLACSKAACKQILDATFLNRLVNAPHSELKLKMGNSIINGRRNVQNSTGRAVKALWGDDEAIARLIRTKQEDAEKEAKLKRDPDFETGATVKPSAGAGAAFKTPSRSNKRGMTGGAGSAAKRHSASSKRLLKLKQEHVNEDEAEEDYEFETPSMPSRRPVIAGRSQAARNDRILSMTSNTTIDPQLNASPRSLDTRPSPASAPAGDLNLSYRLHLCNFLGVGSSHAYQLSLEELRLYAFAYNSDTLSQAWYHHSFTHGESGHGNRIELFTKNGTAQLMPMAQFSQLGHLSALALERGDIDTGGVVINEVVDSHRFESRNLDVLTRQTMGLIQNPFGFFNSSPPPQANTGACAFFHTPPTS